MRGGENPVIAATPSDAFCLSHPHYGKLAVKRGGVNAEVVKKAGRRSGGVME
jgi:hypothetical protein